MVSGNAQFVPTLETGRYLLALSKALVSLRRPCPLDRHHVFNVMDGIDMALLDCPECQHRVSDRAMACPSCGYPLAAPPAGTGANTRPWPGVVGKVAGTWISANALVSIIVGVVMMVGFFAMMIAVATS